MLGLLQKVSSVDCFRESVSSWRKCVNHGNQLPSANHVKSSSHVCACAWTAVALRMIWVLNRNLWASWPGGHTVSVEVEVSGDVRLH